MKILLTFITALAVFSSQAQKKLDYVPLSDTDNSLSPIKQAFNDKLDNIKIVGLGEATHGDKTTFAFNFNMVKYLTGDEGFKTLIIEAPNSVCKPLNNFILNDTAYTLLQTDTLIYKTLPPGAYRDHQFASLIKWLKDYNLNHKTGKINIKGMSLDIVSKYDLLNNDIKPCDLASADVIAKKWQEPGCSKIDQWNDIFNWQDSHGQLISSLPDTVRQRILRDFADTKSAIEFYWDLEIIKVEKDDIVINDRNKPSIIRKDNFFWKLHSNPDYLRKDSLNRFARLYNNRDSIMAANVLRQAGSKRAIVWAHNSHIEKSGRQMMGDYLNKVLGKKYLNVITAYSKAGNIITYDPLQAIRPAPDPLANNTTLKELKRRYNITEGIIFSNDLNNQGYRMVRFPDAGLEGTFLMSTIPLSSFNAMVILGQLYPRDVIEQ